MSQFETSPGGSWIASAGQKEPIPMRIVTLGDQPREEWRAGVETRMHVSACNGTTQLCIFEPWVVPTAGAPTHRHPVEKVLTVITGEAEMWIGKASIILSGGQSLIVPAGQNHGFRNVGSAMLHIHAVLAFSIFEATFDGSAEPVRRWLPRSADSD